MAMRASRKPPEVFAQPPPGGPRRSRLVARGPEEGPIRLGYRSEWYRDLYHGALVMRWPSFLAVGALLYLALSLVFAALYWVRAGAIEHARPGSFADAFFFSVQIMATLGYGLMTPSGSYANIVMTMETMVSLLFVAVNTGLTFARFSRPTARVTFSDVAVVALHNGVPTLSVRLSNGRRNQILEAEVSFVLLRLERTHEGNVMRRFYDLKLLRGHTPVFALTFSAMHAIDRDSPMWGLTPDKLREEDAELLVTVTGLDETMSQTIHARISYMSGEILFGQRFRDMFGYTAEGRLVIDLGKINDVEASELTAPGEAGASGG